MKEIKTVIFDLGGVLIDLDSERGLGSFYELGYPPDEKPIDPYQQHGVFLRLEKGEITPAEYYRSVNEKLPSQVGQEAIRAALLSFMVDIPAYKLDMLRELRAGGYRVFMLSNTNEIIFNWIKETKFTIQGLTVDDYFDRLYLSYRMGVAKPELVIFDMLVADSGIAPSETLFIDDGRANIETARSLGFLTHLAADREDYRPVLKGYGLLK